MDKRRKSKKHTKKGKLGTNKSNELHNNLEPTKSAYNIGSQTMQGDENWGGPPSRNTLLIEKKEPRVLNSKEQITENERSKQSLNNETSSVMTNKPSMIENVSSVESLKHTEKAMSPRTKRSNLVENEHLQKRKKSIVHPYKRSSLDENEQSEQSQNRKDSNTSGSKKLSFEREQSEQSIHKKNSVSSPKMSRSLDSESSVEASKKKSKSKKRKARNSSEEGKKRNQKKTRKDSSRQKKRRESSQESDMSDSSRERTPPVVIVDWSRHCKSMEQKVRKAIKSQKVVVFAKKQTDPNIEQVKNLMAKYCVTYGLIELDDCPYFETQLYNMTCCRCLPLIFIDSMFLGSLAELKTLESMGRMKELLSKKERKH